MTDIFYIDEVGQRQGPVSEQQIKQFAQ